MSLTDPHPAPASRARRATTAATVVALLLGAAACTAGALVSVDAGSGQEPPSDPAIALVITAGGLAGVPVGSSTPMWVHAGAVAAPDGSAVFATRPVVREDGRGFEVLRIDVRTGAEAQVASHVPGPDGIHIAAVAPGGDAVALTAPADPASIGAQAMEEATSVLDLDPSTGQIRSTTTFLGRLEPEGYTLDRTQVFAARIYADGYHVHVLDLATGDQWPTLGPVNPKPETMYGSIVQAVTSPDRTQLATLYRDSSTPDHTGFVHLLRLDSGSTVCIDLHEPFGSDAPGVDAISWMPDGTVAVGHRDPAGTESVVATFDPAAIWSGPPEEHYHADTRRTASPPSVPQGLAATPGFERFVALAT